MARLPRGRPQKIHRLPPRNALWTVTQAADPANDRFFRHRHPTEPTLSDFGGSDCAEHLSDAGGRVLVAADDVASGD